MIEVADIVRRAGDSYRAAFGDRMLPSHERVLNAIERCRTPALGGHVRACDHCAEKRYSYHSCKNRHCPKCQTDDAAAWMARRSTKQLPTDYFLFTFTLPADLRAIARANQRVVYGAMMQAAAESMLAITADPKYVGARPGIVSVLHTWTRDLRFHPHVHMLVTGGGLTKRDENPVWKYSRNPAFLVPDKVVGVLFRAKIRDALRDAGLAADVPRTVWRRTWVVDGKYAGSGVEALGYLARYVFRVAIVNSRIEHFDGEHVTFRYRESKSQMMRRCTLTARNFLSRFLQHVLPKRFVKVRYYGLFAAAAHRELHCARQLLGEPGASSVSCEAVLRTVEETLPVVTADPMCTHCRVGRMRIVETIPRMRAPP